MNTIADYMSQKDEIALLKKQVRSLQKNNSKWKRKFEQLSPSPTRRKTRTIKAEGFVKAWISGDKSLTFNQIAGLCFLSIETIKNISYKLRHQHEK